MNKHPEDYTRQDFKEIMFKQVSMDVGPYKKEIIEETITGRIVSLTISPIPPNLPLNIEFEIPLEIGREIREFHVFEIKGIHI